MAPNSATSASGGLPRGRFRAQRDQGNAGGGDAFLLGGMDGVDHAHRAVQKDEVALGIAVPAGLPRAGQAHA
ncbi:MAG: hypothetical protein HY332_19460 [Chloroflexi bacterium]|nr:hypothetical protein [Chloroflexota bacterium]